MFTIPVSDLLDSFPGDSTSFSFSGEVYDGYMEDIRFLSKLEFTLEIIALENGVSVRFSDLHTEVEYEGKKFPIDITTIDREFHTHIDKNTDPDDIRPIEGGSIDLGPVLREEIIMATHSL